MSGISEQPFNCRCGSSTKVTRPILRYHGGKWRLAPWIISHFPDHRIYVEPYGGAGSVLLRKQSCYSEVYNDLFGEVVNVFQVAQKEGKELKRRLTLTPFARDAYEEAFKPSEDLIQQAVNTIIRSFMGFGSDSITKKSGFRSNSNRNGTVASHDWKNYADLFDMFIERTRGIIIENRPAEKVIIGHDSPETLFYVDPPYLHSTRQSAHRYVYELSELEHSELSELLKSVKGKVIVSGYASELYESLYKDWNRVEKVAFADGAKKRLEVLWMNF